jgi:hypothetical protein
MTPYEVLLTIAVIGLAVALYMHIHNGHPQPTNATELDVERLRKAIYTVSVRHDWANTIDTEDRTGEIAAEYARLTTSAKWDPREPSGWGGV